MIVCYGLNHSSQLKENSFLHYFSYISTFPTMTNILSTFPDDFIKQALTEFKRPSHETIDPTFMQHDSYSLIIKELSKLSEIQRNYHPEVAISMMKDLHVPETVIEAITQRTKSLNRDELTYSWRLDQSVPNVQAVLLNITNCNTGQVHTMRMDLSTFHKLRFNVSLLMKEYEVLAKKIPK